MRTYTPTDVCQIFRKLIINQQYCRLEVYEYESVDGGVTVGEIKEQVVDFPLSIDLQVLAYPAVDSVYFRYALQDYTAAVKSIGKVCVVDAGGVESEVTVNDYTDIYDLVLSSRDNCK